MTRPRRNWQPRASWPRRDEEKTAVLEARVKNDQAAGRLAARIEATAQGAGRRQERDVPSVGRVLARYLEADGKLPEAVRAADRAIAIDPRSIAAWTLAARVRESAGSLGDSADALRRLAEIDRRNRTEHLTGIARLESRLGRIDAALKAGRDLLAAAPGNPDNYEFFAQLCFGLGRSEEGLDALRRAVRVNPNDTKITLTLAETLAGQYRTDEAIEMYWRAFDKAEDLDAKLGIVTKLTELYLQRNQFDRLLTRLQNQEREATSGARASPSSATWRSARPRLMRPRATWEVLAPSSSGCSPPIRGIRSSFSNCRSSRRKRETSRAQPGIRSSSTSWPPAMTTRPGWGSCIPVAASWRKPRRSGPRWPSGKSEAHRIFQAIDSLLAQKKAQPVMEVTESLLRKDPRDWEALYRQGLALVDLQKPAEASRRFQAILDLPIGDDEKSALMKAWSRDPKLRAGGGRSTSAATGQLASIPLQDRISQVLQIRIACKIENRVTPCQPRRWRRSGRLKTSVRRGWRPWAGCSARRSRRARPRAKS